MPRHEPFTLAEDPWSPPAQPLATCHVRRRQASPVTTFSTRNFKGAPPARQVRAEPALRDRELKTRSAGGECVEGSASVTTWSSAGMGGDRSAPVASAEPRPSRAGALTGHGGRRRAADPPRWVCGCSPLRGLRHRAKSDRRGWPVQRCPPLFYRAEITCKGRTSSLRCGRSTLVPGGLFSWSHRNAGQLRLRWLWRTWLAAAGSRCA